MPSDHCMWQEIKLLKILGSTNRVYLRNSPRIICRQAKSVITNYKIAFITSMVICTLHFAIQIFFYIVQWPFMLLKGIKEKNWTNSCTKISEISQSVWLCCEISNVLVILRTYTNPFFFQKSPFISENFWKDTGLKSDKFYWKMSRRKMYLTITVSNMNSEF
jgi:hypothetical protein